MVQPLEEISEWEQSLIEGSHNIWIGILRKRRWFTAILLEQSYIEACHPTDVFS